jgi:hypothetical protein
MSSPIKFFRKSRCDYEFSYVSATASNSPDTAGAVLQRSNRNGWGTSGSSDAENTTLTINFGDTVTIDSILLILHNWKNYQIQYLASDGVTWTDFAPAVHPTTSTDSTTLHSVPTTLTSSLKVTIFGTQVANSEKVLSQFIATTLIGTLTGYPVMDKPTLGRALQEQKLPSGKSRILSNIGGYSVSLKFPVWDVSADLTIFETLANANEGFLFWPCGGDESQFFSVRQGYRLQDIYLVRCKNEYQPALLHGRYAVGLVVQMDIIEVIT